MPFFLLLLLLPEPARDRADEVDGTKDEEHQRDDDDDDRNGLPHRRAVSSNSRRRRRTFLRREFDAHKSGAQKRESVVSRDILQKSTRGV